MDPRSLYAPPLVSPPLVAFYRLASRFISSNKGHLLTRPSSALFAFIGSEDYEGLPREGYGSSGLSPDNFSAKKPNRHHLMWNRAISSTVITGYTVAQGRFNGHVPSIKESCSGFSAMSLTKYLNLCAHILHVVSGTSDLYCGAW